jgi:hypothetical protein
MEGGVPETYEVILFRASGLSLRRPFRRKDVSLRVLDRPEIPRPAPS